MQLYSFSALLLGIHCMVNAERLWMIMTPGHQVSLSMGPGSQALPGSGRGGVVTLRNGTLRTLRAYCVPFALRCPPYSQPLQLE